MNKSLNKTLSKLGKLTDLMLQTKLATLSAAAAECARTQEKIDNLNRPTSSSNELTLVEQERSRLLYETWATNQRRALNEELARQMVVKITAENEARFALGRAEVIKQLGKSAQEEVRKNGRPLS